MVSHRSWARVFFPSNQSLWRPGIDLFSFINFQILIFSLEGSSLALLRKRSRLWEELVSWLLSDFQSNVKNCSSINLETSNLFQLGHCFRQYGENWTSVESFFGELHRVDSWRGRLQVSQGGSYWILWVKSRIRSLLLGCFYGGDWFEKFSSTGIFWHDCPQKLDN